MAAAAQETLSDLIGKCSDNPDREFIHFVGGRRFSLREVDSLSNRLAHGLAGLGVSKGDRVATMLDNSIDAITAWFAASKLGAALVPLNTALKKDFLSRQLQDARATVMIVDHEYVERLRELPDLPGLVDTVAVRAGSGDPVEASFLSLEDLYSPNDDPLPDLTTPSDLAMLVYTSGTTGASKGCMLSQNQICRLGRVAAASTGYMAEDVVWTALPLFHVNAMSTILGAMVVGGRVAVERRFSVSGFWPSIRETGATVVCALGSMAQLIAASDVKESEICFGQLRSVISVPFPPALQQQWMERFGVSETVIPGYGQTEAGLITVAVPGETMPPGASGRGDDRFELRIVDEAGNEVAPGNQGELVCKPRYSNILFSGYWGMPEKTAETIRDGWYHTGDIGRFDDAGYFYFLGRKAEYIRHRGENVSAVEVENTLLQHPKISDAAVYAVPSPLNEDDIMAAITPKANVDLDEKEIFDWASDHLPRFAVPNYIEFISLLPRNPMGKVEKYKLEKRGVTERTWRSDRMQGVQPKCQ